VAQAIGPKTRAVVTVDVNGRGCDYRRLEAICLDANVPLVCDSAEALGSSSGEKSLGTYGAAGIYSFSANKTVTAGQGGAIVTDDETLYSRLRELKDQGRRHGGTGDDDLHPVIGFNFKLTNIQAAIAVTQLARLPGRIDGFLRRDQRYQDALKGCPDIKFPPMSEAGEVRQWTDILSSRRDDIVSALSDQGIGSRPFWLPLHRQKPFQADDAEFPNAINVSRQGLWLPSNFSLTEAEIGQTAQVIRDTLSAS
jgi:perosamine synthetase